MGIFRSRLSDENTEILKNCIGLKVEDTRHLFGNIPIFVFDNRHEFHKHSVSDSISFLVIMNEYIVQTKSIFGGKTITYR